MVKILDDEGAHLFLESRLEYECVVLAARAALRGVSGLGLADDETLRRLILPTLRASLTPVAAGTCQAQEASYLINAAAVHSAATAKAASATARPSPGVSRSVAAAVSAARSAAAVPTKNIAEFPFADDAHSAVLAAAAVHPNAKSASYSAFSQDASVVKAGESAVSLFHFRVWQDVDEPDELAEARAALLRFLDADPAIWGFWARWYRGMFDGQPMDWALQRAVALIPDDVWQAGPEAVAARIAEIEAEFASEAVPTAHHAPTQDKLERIKILASTNRDALTVSAAGLLEQISIFREQVRVRNDLDPEYKEKLLAYLDELRSNLERLLELLPSGSRIISDERANGLSLWLQDFGHFVRYDAKRFVSPENVAGATIPTGIILGCTGVGAMLGWPLEGSVVGGLLTGQLKPGKAAQDLFTPKGTEAG